MFIQYPLDNKLPAINPVVFGSESCKPSHHFGPAVRMYWLIHFVVSGFGIFRINGETFHLGPGEMFVISPFTETYYEADAKKPWKYIWIGFTCNGDLPLTLPPTVHCPRALETFEMIRNCYHLNNGRDAYLLARIWDLFSLITEKEKNEPDHVQETLRYIRSQYMNDISVSRIAEELHLDRSYLSTLFKSRIGISPGQYLLNYRMTVATSLMDNPKNSVTVIAASVGYPDLYNFSRMFKRHFGVSPTAYIKRLHEGHDHRLSHRS